MERRKGDNKMKTMSEELYDELCKTLTDWENRKDDDYLSDTEWLDVFYDLCVRMQRELGK